MRGQAAAASGYLIQITARSVNRSHHLPVTAMVVMPIVMPLIAVRVVAVVIIIRWDNVVGARDDADGSDATGAAFDALQTATKAQALRPQSLIYHSFHFYPPLNPL